jgi:hypothetical protein
VSEESAKAARQTRFWVHQRRTATGGQSDASHQSAAARSPMQRSYGMEAALSSSGPMQATLGVVTQAAQIQLRYAVRASVDEWTIPENWPVPESIPHTLTADHFCSVLSFWASRAQRPLFVARNLAVRWLESKPSVGVDPDVCLLDPPPPEVLELTSLRLWKFGHTAPTFCLEVVSQGHPYKDYVAVHERYAAFGAPELVVFDPFLAGPKAFGGPVLIQIWRRDELGVFERQYAGPGPAWSETLEAWLIANGNLLELADNRAGSRRWLTREEYERTEKEREQAEKEHERAEKERERAEKERERAEKEREREARIDLERRLAALEQSLGDKGSTG